MIVSVRCGIAYLSGESVDWVNPIVSPATLEADILRACEGLLRQGEKLDIVQVTLWWRDQCNLEFSPGFLGFCARAGATLGVSCDEAEDGDFPEDSDPGSG